MRGSLVKLGAGVMALATLGACGEFADAPFGPASASFVEGGTGYLDVWKWDGPAGTYDFEASATGGNFYATKFSLSVGQGETIWYEDDILAPLSDVTVTENAGPGVLVDSIVVRYYDGTTWSEYTLIGTNSATVSVDAFRIAKLKFFNSYEPPSGGEGCTPGYWRQEQHFDSWTATGYAPGDSFDAVFGVSYGGTLLAAVWARGGDVHALARHAVAALLNASSPDVDYPSTAAEVIAAVQEAFGSGDFEEQKDIFEEWNEAGCELD